MSLRQAIVATLAGVALSFLPLGLGTLAGKWSGQPTMVVSRATFGHVGNILPAIVAVLIRVFWGGVLLWLLAVSSARLLVFAGLDAGLGEAVWTFVILGIGFVIAIVIAIFGYGFVARLQLIASILSGLLVAGADRPDLPAPRPRRRARDRRRLVDARPRRRRHRLQLRRTRLGAGSSDLARYQRPASSGARLDAVGDGRRDAAAVRPDRLGRDARRVRPAIWRPDSTASPLQTHRADAAALVPGAAARRRRSRPALRHRADDLLGRVRAAGGRAPDAAVRRCDRRGRPGRRGRRRPGGARGRRPRHRP